MLMLISDPKQKVQTLKKLEMTHLKQLIKSQENAEEIEEMVASYNELV